MDIIHQSLVWDQAASKEVRAKLLRINPKIAILGLLDKIFDYFTFEDLERVAWVWKLFWYVATLDKLYVKYEIMMQVQTLTDNFNRKEVKALQQTLEKERKIKDFVIPDKNRRFTKSVRNYLNFLSTPSLLSP